MLLFMRAEKLAEELAEESNRYGRQPHTKRQNVTYNGRSVVPRGEGSKKTYECMCSWDPRLKPGQ